MKCRNGLVMKNKFTLLELLIVVAIFGILLSILLPSLGKAREKARRAVCLSNLSQNHKVVTIYAMANNNKLIDANDDIPEHTPWVNNHFLSLFENPDSLFCPNMSKPKNRTIPENKRLLGYGYLGSKQKIVENHGYELADSLTDDSNIPLFIDRNEGSTQGWHVFAHTPQGEDISPVFINPLSSNIDGGNIVYLDGSARWNSKTSMDMYYGSTNTVQMNLWNYRDE